MDTIPKEEEEEEDEEDEEKEDKDEEDEEGKGRAHTEGCAKGTDWAIVENIKLRNQIQSLKGKYEKMNKNLSIRCQLLQNRKKSVPNDNFYIKLDEILRRKRKGKKYKNNYSQTDITFLNPFFSKWDCYFEDDYLVNKISSDGEVEILKKKKIEKRANEIMYHYNYPNDECTHFMNKCGAGKNDSSLTHTSTRRKPIIFPFCNKKLAYPRDRQNVNILRVPHHVTHKDNLTYSIYTDHDLIFIRQTTENLVPNKARLDHSNHLPHSDHSNLKDGETNSYYHEHGGKKCVTKNMNPVSNHQKMGFNENDDGYAYTKNSARHKGGKKNTCKKGSVDTHADKLAVLPLPPRLREEKTDNAISQFMKAKQIRSASRNRLGDTIEECPINAKNSTQRDARSLKKKKLSRVEPVEEFGEKRDNINEETGEREKIPEKKENDENDENDESEENKYSNYSTKNMKISSAEENKKDIVLTELSDTNNSKIVLSKDRENTVKRTYFNKTKSEKWEDVCNENDFLNTPKGTCSSFFLNSKIEEEERGGEGRGGEGRGGGLFINKVNQQKSKKDKTNRFTLEQMDKGNTKRDRYIDVLLKNVDEQKNEQNFSSPSSSSAAAEAATGGGYDKVDPPLVLSPMMIPIQCDNMDRTTSHSEFIQKRGNNPCFKTLVDKKEYISSCGVKKKEVFQTLEKGVTKRSSLPSSPTRNILCNSELITSPSSRIITEGSEEAITKFRKKQPHLGEDHTNQISDLDGTTIPNCLYSNNLYTQNNYYCTKKIKNKKNKNNKTITPGDYLSKIKIEMASQVKLHQQNSCPHMGIRSTGKGAVIEKSRDIASSRSSHSNSHGRRITEVSVGNGVNTCPHKYRPKRGLISDGEDLGILERCNDNVSFDNVEKCTNEIKKISLEHKKRAFLFYM
ncbi:hypothetical protein, conserved [Plasmodium gonderi]|uniref:Uncharacterized protein n=1 Tax=Plasmodium gonderi TaxID=77519 RepID=A0A1Y1JCH9_PLAGO|nr:hypothetical protein, conserved [Plasmodium gonderi]GAW79940.1 hypothetical protein, conserved [Plasmodium gonderi]